MTALGWVALGFVLGLVAPWAVMLARDLAERRHADRPQRLVARAKKAWKEESDVERDRAGS